MTAKSFSLRFISFMAVFVLALFIGRWSVTRTAQVSHALPVSSATRKGVAVPTPAETVSSTSDAISLAKRAAHAVGSLAAEDERQHVLDQWAATDPRAALDFARTQLKGDRQAQAISSIITIWGKNDPAAAWKWVGTEMPNAAHLYDALLEVFGRNSPELAAQYAATQTLAHPEAALEVNLAALLGVTYNGNFSAALALIDRNAASDPELLKTLSNFVAGQWARFAPQEAKTWVMGLPEGEQRTQALIGLGESWSEADPAGAASFAAELPEGESRSLAMRQAISKWVQNDPAAARAWVMQTNQVQDFDAAMEAIATQNNFMYREPAAAMVWATGIFNEAERVKTMSTVLHNWYSIDNKAATDYLQSSPEFTPEKRADLLKQLQSAR